MPLVPPNKGQNLPVLPNTRCDNREPVNSAKGTVQQPNNEINEQMKNWIENSEIVMEDIDLFEDLADVSKKLHEKCDIRHVKSDKRIM